VSDGRISRKALAAHAPGANSEFTSCALTEQMSISTILGLPVSGRMIRGRNKPFSTNRSKRVGWIDAEASNTNERIQSDWWTRGSNPRYRTGRRFRRILAPQSREGGERMTLGDEKLQGID
jgi:hypothetical protein